MVLIAAAVGVISMFLPWFSISLPLYGTESISGMHDWGILVLICFLTAGALAFLGDQSTNLNRSNWMAVLIASGIAALITLIKVINPPVLFSAGFGLFIALAAAIGIAAFTFMNRSAEDNLQNGFDSLKDTFNSKINTASGGTTTTTTSTTNASHTPTNDPSRPTV